VVTAAGLATSTPLPILGWAAAFVCLAVECDVRCRRIPNALTLPALVLALGLAGGIGGPADVAFGLMGIATAFALLLVPYAAGGLGAGDVKSAMAIGALVGPVVIASILGWALLFGGMLAVVQLVVAGELTSLAQRWTAMLGAALVTRRWVTVATAPASGARRGIPFAVALGLAVAAQAVTGGLR
jgi:prepilin peptidase CpaA